MCGIIGSVVCRGVADVGAVKKQMSKFVHRGPDASGVWVSNNAQSVFGHRRLAIVELTDAGAQPMSYGGITITFNGEIYNHHELRERLKSDAKLPFKGSSDTEVLLKGYFQYGAEFFKLLNGTFAFAIHDGRNNSTILCRDRAGEKPLFYFARGCKLHFSSDLRSVAGLASLSKIKKSSLLQYTQNGYVFGNEHWFDGVEAVEPGCYVVFNNSNVDEPSKFSFWELSANNDIKYDFNLLNEKFAALLQDAVKLQLNCDVPAAILLSGGLDSSVITAIAANITAQVNTFTVKFPNDAAFDEAYSARLIAEHYGTNHTEIDGSEIAPDLMLKIADNLDIPVNDSSLLPTYLVNYELSKSYKVAIGGDGADELFGGYKHYARIQILFKYLKFLPYNFFSISSDLADHFLPLDSKYRNWLELSSQFYNGKLHNVRSFYGKRTLDNLIRGVNHLDLQDDWAGKVPHDTSWMQKYCIADFMTYLRESILIKSDRCSMLNSVEARAPFLDYRLIDFAFNEVPDSFKIRGGMKKWFIKKFASNLLPENFDFNRKLGFNLPLGSMIRDGKWREFFGDTILTSPVEPEIKNFYVKLFDEHQQNRNHADRLFGHVLLSLWLMRNEFRT